ncbi:caprin homolog [Wyeomyia smithii]|uniref:caprin homolog n=1 Tax=Wyeomyia smithii TaxID=174621 RepID=UPI002467EEAF|nr:caprin homolog [Wyeomyia smithii]
MPSLKVLEGSKNSESELLHNSVETAAGNDGCSSTAKDPQQPQTAASALASSTNGSVKEQPASPLQQIVLIIEHKIRNLEKRKNKLESYKAIEKSGKKLTTDQKNAVSKYDECLTSLELARELCKQFQSIATVANKEAKKEAKRTAFVKAQQESAKVREVLVIQDVLRRLTEDDGVRSDFCNGENGACKISAEDLSLLEKLHEETRPQRPKTSLQPAFVVSVKTAADHLSAVVDGRNKAYGDSTYVHLKNVISEVQDCGYFEQDIVVVDEESEDHVVEETNSTENEIIGAAEEATMEEVRTNADVAVDPAAPDLEKQEKDNPVTHLAQPIEPKSFGEAPAAAAVPTPSFPMHTHVIRQNPVPSPAIPVIVDNQNGPLIAPPIQVPSPVIAPNTGIIPRNTAHVQSTATVVPTVPVTVPVIQPAAVPLQPISGQQLAATTVQAVEHAYFKQHYIQQQMRPIHEVIGTGNFFFLQESELDKPDVVSPPVPFAGNVHHLATNAAPTSPANPQQSIQQIAPAPQPSPAPVSVQPQPPMISAQTTTFSNQPFQNMAAPTKVYNNPLQPVEQSHPPGVVNMTQGSPLVPKASDISGKPVHIPADINMQNVLPKPQPQEHVQIEHQSNQKNQLPQQKPSPFSAAAGQQPAVINPIHEPNTQQFPTLMQSLHDSQHQITSNHISQKLSNLMVDPATEKLKSINMTDKLAINANHTSQQPKPRHDEWSSRGQSFVSLAKNEDQWVTNTAQMSKPIEDGSQDKASYNMPRQSQHQLLQQVTSSSSSSSSNSVPANTGAPNRIQHNGNSASNYGMGNMTDTSSSHGQSQQSLPNSAVQQLHQGGHRNPRGGHQYNQNSGSNSRFSNDSGANNPPTTFYKNNERFYQQNQQSNNFGSSKSDSSYHQRGSMFKGRQDNGGSDSASMVAGYGSMVGSNVSGGTNNNNNSNNNNSSSMDYRSNARPINSTRNTGPPSTRPQQRNHSGNSNYGGPRGSSNTRGQHTINA